MRNTYTLVCLLSLVLIASCSSEKKPKTLVVKNTLRIERSSETVELSKETLGVTDLATVGLKDVSSGTLQVTQLVDNDGDGSMDVLLFQPKMKPSSEAKFEVVTITEAEQPESKLVCYSRFVPERTDDYTWENDKVAFRVYGPVAQQIQESGEPGGTLSSGVDAWLKRVSYPIINKWYKKNDIRPGAYHEDSGDGLDNFHVGVSRGVGGIAVRNNGEFYYSKNYTKWRTITTGSLRTSFYLEYETWDAGGKMIKESKIITLDKGSNLSKFETTIEGSNEISAGLTLHEKDGKVSSGKGWVSYWQPHPESEIGCAIVADKKTFSGYEKYDVEAKDLSNAYAHLNVNNNKVTYYAGFAWSKSKQFPTTKSWEAYLDSFSEKIDNPLNVKLVN